MLQRIYATSFPKKAQLDGHLHKLEEAKSATTQIGAGVGPVRYSG